MTGHSLRACKINRGIDNSIPGVNELIGDMKDFHSSYSDCHNCRRDPAAYLSLREVTNNLLKTHLVTHLPEVAGRTYAASGALYRPVYPSKVFLRHGDRRGPDRSGQRRHEASSRRAQAEALRSGCSGIRFSARNESIMTRGRRGAD